MKSLAVDDGTVAWIGTTLDAEKEEAVRAHTNALKRLEANMDTIDSRLETMYMDRLEGRIEVDFFEKMSSSLKDQRDTVRESIQSHRSAIDGNYSGNLDLLELARTAYSRFLEVSTSEKRELLKYLLSNCTWKDGGLTPELRYPFKEIADTNTRWLEMKAAGAENLDERSVWYPVRDSNYS